MGPSRLFKNRSQHSILNTQEANASPYSASPVDSPQQSPGFPPPSSAPPHYDDDVDEPESSYSLPYRSEEAQYYNHPPAGPPGHQRAPSRSQSQRSPVSNHPTIQLVRPPHGVASSTPTSAIEPDEPDRYYYNRAPNPPPHKEDRRKRRFFGLGSSKEPTSATPAQKLGRSRSVRGKEYSEPLVEAPKEHSRHLSHHHHWNNTHVSPTTDDDEDEDGGAGLHPSHSSQSSVAGPGPPEKDPLRSPGFPPAISHQEYTRGKGIANHNQGVRQPDKQGSYQTWDRVAQQTQHQDSSQVQTPTSYHPSPASATSTSGQQFHKPPQDAIREHWQEHDSRPSSRQSIEPSVQPQHPYGHHARTSSSQASSASYMQGSMGPPPLQGQAPNRRSTEAPGDQQRGQSREGTGYQPYSQNIQGAVLPSNAPPQYSAQLTPQQRDFRGGAAQPSPMQQQGSIEQDRRSPPPPSRSRDDLSSLDVAQLLARHDELQDKYRKVKKYYFDKDAQVTQLQNTLAHQRLSLSRTSLDDNEYANRFSRLDGAINNLAFNIRRDWRSVPPWLAPHVNRDAATQPTKEMTAVGRAAISRWIVEELLDRYFHPAIEPGFSAQLKIIEKNLRRFAPATNTDDEKDNLLSKISNWRLSTLDGLSEVLASPQAAEYRAQLTASLVEKLVASLSMLLKDPAPPGLDGGVSMIVELAVGIAANLPLESREVFVNYIIPGQPINETLMKVETGLPVLTNPGDGPIDPGDNASLLTSGSKQNEETGSIESRETGNSNGGNGSDDTPVTTSPAQQQAERQAQLQKQQQEAQASVAAKKKGGMFGSFIGGGGTSAASAKKQGAAGPIGVLAAQQQAQAQAAAAGEPQKKEERVRFSAFMAVEVRGRSVLVKAPVYVRD